MRVRPLPPAPAGFRGAVGQLRIAAELDPEELRVGEAATLTLRLEGRGHLKGLQPPQLPEMAGIEVFPPQQQSSESLQRKSIAGERTWSFVLVPERPGHWELPAIEVPYFDPQEERYRTAEAQPLSLRVRGSTRVAHPDGRTIDLHPIRTAALPAVAGRPGSRYRPWLFTLPWMLAIAIFLARRRDAGSERRSERRRLLERLQNAAEEDHPRRAGAEIEEAWREFLCRRWGLPQGSPSSQWEAQLVGSGVPEATAEELVKLADDLHYLRYAPKLSSTAELRRDLVERSRKLARAAG